MDKTDFAPTKANPAANDCYSRALPDEPLFTLLARDPTSPATLKFWAVHREAMIARGDAPADDMSIVEQARDCAVRMGVWRLNNGPTKDREATWRTKRNESDTYREARLTLADMLRERVPGTAEGIADGGELTVLEHNAVEAIALLLDAAYDGRNGNHDGQTSIFSRR